MTRYPSRSRYVQFVQVLGGVLALSAVVLGVVFGLRAMTIGGGSDDAQAAWDEQAVKNEFYEALAGEPIREDTPTTRLARDLEAWTEGKEGAELVGMVAEFYVPVKAERTSAYVGAERALETQVFQTHKECVECGRLTPEFQRTAVRALEGDLTNLVLPIGERPSDVPVDRWPHPGTVLALLVLASSVGLVLASQADNTTRSDEHPGEGPLVWAFDGNHPGPKALAVLLAPHALGPLTLGAFVQAHRPRLQRELERRRREQEAARQVETQAAETARLLRPIPGAEPALKEAQANLAALLTLTPRTEAVEEATSEVRRIVAELLGTPGAAAEVTSDLQARRLLEESRILLEVREAAVRSSQETYRPLR